MRKLFFLLGFSLLYSTFSANLPWNNQRLTRQVEESQVFFIGTIKDYTKTYFIYESDTKKPKEISKEEAIKYYNSLLKKKNKSKAMPRITFKIIARVLVKENLKGYYKENDIISLEWEDLHDSMCPHPKSSAVDKKDYIWFEQSEHTKKKPTLFIISIKHKAQLTKLLSQKEKDHKKKITNLLNKLNDNNLKDDQVFNILLELEDYDDDIVEEKISIKVKDLQKGNPNYEDYIEVLVNILIRKNKIKVDNFPKEIQRDLIILIKRKLSKK